MTAPARTTASTSTALKRLEAVTGVNAPKRGSLAHRLSTLAHAYVHSQKAAEIREAVKYKPTRVPVKGMVGWQVEALERLSVTHSANYDPARRQQRRARRSR